MEDNRNIPERLSDFIKQKGKQKFIHWKDVYSGGHIRGATHVIEDGAEKSLCGLSAIDGFWDGGYDTVEDKLPNCKKCLKKLGRI